MTDPRLAARTLRLAYGATPVIEGLDLAIEPGRFTALVGPNGCGKSTLLRALAGLHAPASGQVVLDGASIARRSTRALAREIGLLAQSASPAEGMTVEELVEQGRYPHRSVLGPWRARDQEAVEEALALTSLTDLRNSLVDRLSGGQRQRAWIAMVLAQQSTILLLDEPTTYLDLAHQVEVLGLMERLVKEYGATVVAVLHDLSQAARHADTMVALKAGRIIAAGPPSEVVTPEVLRTAFNVEATVLTDPDTGTPLCLPRRTVPE
ncbi:ABC transporter ATP-binding protein [Vannielia litorea]|uniref:ABC transporter ATP-binding protein n=1 Tax=Vannielia litorea TaxID=1217970 RepID=UPI001C98919F|nr:ABC transporter ATP-binding protein [Vannielia litorea]MBY6047859.1 ABC transporter ATP-binding protein [Vannielia litorea]MBY6075273.1 ABC transporter ATP-binding protein [Vannielia litorea]